MRPQTLIILQVGLIVPRCTLILRLKKRVNSDEQLLTYNCVKRMT